MKTSLSYVLHICVGADFHFLFRPLRSEVWLAITALSVFPALLLFLRPAKSPYEWHEPDGRRAASTAVCAFFALANAFYCGALTMFLATAPGLPFDGEEGVIGAYPEWRLVIHAGTETHYEERVGSTMIKESVRFRSLLLDFFSISLRSLIPRYQARAGHPLYTAFWERLESDPDSHFFSSVASGIRLLAPGDRVVLHTLEEILKAELRENPAPGANLRLFGRSRTVWEGLIFPLSSPLPRLFKCASADVRDAGMAAKLLGDEQGGGSSRTKRAAVGERIVIGNKHFVAGYVGLAASVIACFGILGIELVCAKRLE